METAAKKANPTKRMSSPVTRKSIQDRYKRIQGRFDEQEKVDRPMSGVGGELGEIEDLFGSMKEALQDLLKPNSATRKAAQQCEAEKKHIEEMVRSKARSRIKSHTHSDLDIASTDGEAPEVTSAPIRWKHKRMQVEAFQNPLAYDIASFTAAFKHSDDPGLALEEHRFQMELEERRMEREERRIEREQSNKPALEKFKIMMEAFKQC